MIFVMLLLTPAHAQQNEYYASVYFMPSVQFFKFDNLNRLLKQNGFPETGVVYTNGFGGYGTIHRWRIGGEGMYFSGSSGNANNETSMSGGLGYFYTGYNLSFGRWQLIPAAGFGWGGLTVNATRQTDTSLQNLLSTQPNSSQITNGNSFIHTGLSLERILANSFYLGIKGSYNAALSSTTWSAPGLTSSVADPFGGFQASLVVGFLLK